MSTLLWVGSCKEKEKTPLEMITKSWRMDKFKIKGPNEASPQMMAGASFTFTKDMRYEIVFGGPDKGTWQFGPNNKTLLTTNEQTGQVSEIDIEFLSDSLLILKNDVGPAPVRMELKPQ